MRVTLSLSFFFPEKYNIGSEDGRQYVLPKNKITYIVLWYGSSQAQKFISLKVSIKARSMRKRSSALRFYCLLRDLC